MGQDEGMKKSIALLLCPSVLLAACAATPPSSPVSGQGLAQLTAEVQPQGGDTFLIALPGVKGGPSPAALKAQGLQKADEYCASLNKGLKVEDDMKTATQPAGYEVRFSCAARPAPE